MHLTLADADSVIKSSVVEGGGVGAPSETDKKEGIKLNFTRVCC